MANTVTLEERIEKVVDDLVNSDEMFTLLDVSQNVKDDGGPWVSHTAMKPTIEDVLRNRFATAMTMAYYTESLIQVHTPVGFANARLFHPIHEDPNNYMKRAQKAKGPQRKRAKKPGNTVKTKPVLPGHPTITGRKVVKGRKQQRQGYVEVPKAIWMKAGFKPNDDVVITTHGESATILRNVKGAKHYTKCQKFLGGKLKTKGVASRVPPAGRFRLSPTNLQDSNLFDFPLDFSAFTDKIVVCKKA